MSRDASGVYSAPSGSTAVSGSTISSVAHNALVADLVADANTPRPAVAGGTGVDALTSGKVMVGAGTTVSLDKDAPSGDFVGTSDTQTLTNKTMTAPTLNTPAISDPTITGTMTLPAGGIETADLADDAVTLAKMAGGTAGNLITYDASGDPGAVATGTDGQVLVSNGAGAAPTFQDTTSFLPIKAWVNFDGTGTPSIRADTGVVSVGRLATGRYRINLSPAMANANYTVIATAGNSANAFLSAGVSSLTASNFEVYVYNGTSAAGTDAEFVNVAVISN